MKLKLLFIATVITSLLTASSFADDLKGKTWLYTQTADSQKSMTADIALQKLKEGNARLVSGNFKNRDFEKQIKITGNKGQFPFAIVLSCMDSRGSSELIFDQGIGDIFSVRLAGNVLDADQLGGLEFATAVVGSHLIVVMGHTRCGAVAGACSGAKLGHLTQLLGKIQPAVNKIKKEKSNLNCEDPETIDAIAKQNVLDVIKEIRQQSPIIESEIKSGEVKIVGAMQDVQTGKVTFFE